MIKNKTIKLNDDCYEVLYVLPMDKKKIEAETAVFRYSTEGSPAILMQLNTGQWVITRKVKDVIFTDISDVNLNENEITSQISGGSTDGLNNKEEN